MGNNFYCLATLDGKDQFARINGEGISFETNILDFVNKFITVYQNDENSRYYAQ